MDSVVWIVAGKVLLWVTEERIIFGNQKGFSADIKRIRNDHGNKGAVANYTGIKVVTVEIRNILRIFFDKFE